MLAEIRADKGRGTRQKEDQKLRKTEKGKERR